MPPLANVGGSAETWDLMAKTKFRVGDVDMGQLASESSLTCSHRQG